MRSRSSRPNEIVEKIGLELRALYCAVLREPVPDRFRELLGRLESGAIAAVAQPQTSCTDRNATGMACRPRSGKAYRLEPAE